MLREKGVSYGQIAAALNMSVNTVKSFCRRSKITVLTTLGNYKYVSYCKKCGEELVQTPKRKKKIFCSFACRMEWWKVHPNSVKRKAVYSFICHFCKNEFTAYGNKGRKFCSHSCYINDRFGGSADEG
jgi:hypothetical protein